MHIYAHKIAIKILASQASLSNDRCKFIFHENPFGPATTPVLLQCTCTNRTKSLKCDGQIRSLQKPDNEARLRIN